MNCNCEKAPEFPTKAFIPGPIEIPINFRAVTIPADQGDDTTNPPLNGAYRNVVLKYAANAHVYIYSSDGIPVMLVGGINFDEIANRPLYDGEPMTSDTNIPDLTDEIETLQEQIQALATDFSYKGSVEDYAHLPSDAATGDVYTTTDTGVIYVWDGNAWVALNEYPSVFTGTDGISAGEEGLVPAPATTDIGKYLNADGTWKEVAGITELTSADYDYPSGSADGVALWELDEGLYSANDGVKVYLSSVASHDISSNPKMIMVVKDSGVASIYVFVGSKVTKVSTRADSTEVVDTWGSMLDSTDLAQSTGASTLIPMSQKATTVMIHPTYTIGGDETIQMASVNIGSGNSPANSRNVFITGERDIHKNYSSSQYDVLVAGYVKSQNEQRPKNRWVAIGGTDSNFANDATYSTGSVNIGVNATTGFINSIDSSHPTQGGIAIGYNSYACPRGSIALGYKASLTGTSDIGVMTIGTTDTDYGYNSSNYRLLTGLYDPQNAHDAATKGYVDSAAGGTFPVFIDSTLGAGFNMYKDVARTQSCTFQNILDATNAGKSVVLVRTQSGDTIAYNGVQIFSSTSDAEYYLQVVSSTDLYVLTVDPASSSATFSASYQLASPNTINSADWSALWQ